MKRAFVLMTRTRWDETPRLRHQVALMLARRGHPVQLFERPGWRTGPSRMHADGVELHQRRELLHHQLRLHPWIEAANTRVELASLRTVLAGTEDAVVLNFRHDFTFVRRLFPTQPVITVLNDDFVAGAKQFSRRAATGLLERTVRASGQVLAVSHAIAAQARAFSPSVALFFPWARRPYERPATTVARTDLLYWGFLNERVDFDVVRAVMDSGIRLHFAGPVSGEGTAGLLAHPRATYHGVASLDDLAAVRARCAAAILPYDLHGRQRFGEMVAAITVNNRAFDLLATGLPLLYADLPGLIEAPVEAIVRCRTAQDYIDATTRVAKLFDSSQPVIEQFLRAHTEDARYDQLQAVVADLDAQRPTVTRQRP